MPELCEPTDRKLNEETHSLSLAEIPYKKVLSRQPSLTLCNIVSILETSQQNWNTFALHAVSYAMFIFPYTEIGIKTYTPLHSYFLW